MTKILKRITVMFFVILVLFTVKSFAGYELADPNSSEDPINSIKRQDVRSGKLESINTYITKHENGEAAIGIDVSSWQGEIDWSQVARSGVKYAIIRAGYRTTVSGKLFEDAYCKKNIEGAINNGIYVGVYCYSTALNEKEALEEANMILDVVKGYDIKYFIAYDFENFIADGFRTDNLGADQINKNARIFLDKVKENGYTPCLYGSSSYLKDIWKMSEFTDCATWVAHYNVDKPTYTGEYDMWQLTSNGEVSGIKGAVDINVDYTYYFKYNNVDITPYMFNARFYADCNPDLKEMLDYVKNEWEINRGFSYIYAAEIDRGNQAVIGALKELILSENNTAYLDREMILGILRSDSGELHELICRLLLAARLQEGLRQAICETMDEGTPAAYGKLLKVIEDNDLIRFSSVKRAVSAWIGIFDENNVDRVNGKLLSLMGQSLRDKEFCRKQLETNDAVAINTSLWALGFFEVQEAIQAMEVLIDKGTKAQKLAASYYNLNLHDESLKIRAAKKVVLEHSDDLELTAAFLPAYLAPLYRQIRDLLYGSGGRSVYPRESVTPRKPELTEYFKDREEAEKVYDIFMDIYKRLPKKGITWSPCLFPWYSVGLTPSVVIEQLAFTAYVLQDEEKITYMAEKNLKKK